MKKRGTPEADIQRAIVSFLRAVLPKGSIIHHAVNEIASGGRAGHMRQAILVGMACIPASLIWWCSHRAKWCFLR